MNYLWLILLWLLYFILHSVTASHPIKNSVLSMGISAQFYRLMFNIFALLSLIPILIYSSVIDSDFVVIPNIYIKVSGLIIAGWGIVTARIALKSYDVKAFLGLKNLSVEDEFRTDGLLKSVRHPLYSGSILLIIGYFLFSPKISSMISACMLIIYFLIGIQFEEKKLIKTFGDKYLDYKKNTPMLIPRFWKRS